MKTVGFVSLILHILKPLRQHLSFDEKRTKTKTKYLLPVCHILRNFTEGNAGKFTVSFVPMLLS